MSALGAIQTVLATGLIEAVKADLANGINPINIDANKIEDGATADWLRRTAKDVAAMINEGEGIKTLHLDKQMRGSLTTTLNCALRTITGPDSIPLNAVFRQLAGRDHDVFAREHRDLAKPNEPWYVPKPK